MSKKKKQKITGEELGQLLYNIHEHIVHKDGSDDIIYYEKDLIKLFVKLGLPKPIFEEEIEAKKILSDDEIKTFVKTIFAKNGKMLKRLAHE